MYEYNYSSIVPIIEQIVRCEEILMKNMSEEEFKKSTMDRLISSSDKLEKIKPEDSLIKSATDIAAKIEEEIAELKKRDMEILKVRDELDEDYNYKVKLIPNSDIKELISYLEENKKKREEDIIKKKKEIGEYSIEELNDPPNTLSDGIEIDTSIIELYNAYIDSLVGLEFVSNPTK